MANLSTVVVIDKVGLILTDNISLYVEDNNSTSEFEDLSLFLMNPLHYSIVMSIIGIAGCVFNIVALQVITKSKIPSPFKSSMIVLTIMDLIQCFGLLPKFFIGEERPGFVLGSHMLENFGGAGSTWFTALLTIERYGAVCKPFEHLSWWTKRKLIIVTLSLIILITAVNIPGWYLYFRLYKNTVTHQLKFGIQTYWIIAFLTETLSCGAAIIYCNFAIFRQIRRPSIRKSSTVSTTPSDNQVALTKLTMLVGGVYLSIHFIPKVIYAFLPFFLDEKHPPFAFFYPTILTGLNSAINSIIYCAAAKNMREKYIKLLCCK